MSLRLSQLQTVLAVASGLLLVTNVYLGLSYLSAQDQRGRLDGQLKMLEQSLQRLVGTPEAGAPGEPASGVTFPENPPGIELTDLIIRSSQETGTEILGLHAAAVETEQLGGGTYRVLKVNLRIRGGADGMVEFFERLERGTVPALVFDNIDVDSAGETWDVSLDLLAYAQGA